MSFEMIFFILVGALSVGTAVGVVTSRIAVHSALFLLVHFATLAILYVTLNAQFLAAAQIIVYAGGFVILILFVIMLIGSAPLETRAGYRSWVPYAGLALGVVMLAGMALTVLQMPPATINPAAVACSTTSRARGRREERSVMGGRPQKAGGWSRSRWRRALRRGR